MEYPLPPSPQSESNAVFGPQPSISASSTGERARARLTARRAGIRRRVIVIAMILIGGLGGIYGVGRASRKRRQEELDAEALDAKDRPPTVNVVKASRAPATVELSLPAEVRAFYETTIFARTNGYVQRWLVDIGDHVKTGQLLVTIDTPELDARLAEARAKVNALEAEVRVAETQVGFARITAERWEAAAPEGAVSRQERDEKQAQFTNAQARLDAARAQLELGKSTVKGLEFEANFKNVTAPFDGVITQRHIDVGSLITAGSAASTTSLFSIAQYDRVRVFVKVPQASTCDIREGMNARIIAREYPHRVFSGTVDRTSGAIEPASRTLKVELLTSNPDLALLPGMFVVVDFQIVRPEPPLTVLASSLNLRTKGPQVAIIEKDDRVRFKHVEVVRDLGDAVEIADGLRGDEWLAVNLSDEIGDGDPVQPVPLDETPNGPSSQTRTVKRGEELYETKSGSPAQAALRSSIR